MKNAKVIALWGKGGTGKTTTLNILIDRMKSISRLVDIGKISVAPKDNWAIFEYKGKMVGIVTAGDDGNVLKEGFKELDQKCELCDVYVCATRTKRSSCKYIESEFPDSNIMWQRKWSITIENGSMASLKKLQDDANKKQASALIDAIDALL